LTFVQFVLLRFCPMQYSVVRERIYNRPSTTAGDAP
jgi:hypothetical protein